MKDRLSRDEAETRKAQQVWAGTGHRSLGGIPRTDASCPPMQSSRLVPLRVNRSDCLQRKIGVESGQERENEQRLAQE
ncbi:hypothetical protein GCM10028796_13450 [Ramlibacter monticola]